jgi:hypothetical protein
MKKILVLLLFLFLTCQKAYAVELLIMAISGKDNLHYKKNQVVLMREDGYNWKEKCLGCSKDIWKIVKIDKYKAEQFKSLLEVESQGMTISAVRKYTLTLDASTVTPDKENLYIVPKEKISAFISKVIE